MSPTTLTRSVTDATKHLPAEMALQIRELNIAYNNAWNMGYRTASNGLRVFGAENSVVSSDSDAFADIRDASLKAQQHMKSVGDDMAKIEPNINSVVTSREKERTEAKTAAIYLGAIGAVATLTFYGAVVGIPLGAAASVALSKLKDHEEAVKCLKNMRDRFAMVCKEMKATCEQFQRIIEILEPTSLKSPLLKQEFERLVNLHRDKIETS